MSVTKDQVKEFLGAMTVVELSALIKELEEAWGVSAAAPVAVAAAAAPSEAAAPAAEKTDFKVILTAFGEQKIQVIKVIRAITGLGLKEAKDLVEGVPGTVKEAAPKEEAEEIKKKLEEVGAKVEIK